MSIVHVHVCDGFKSRVIVGNKRKWLRSYLKYGGNDLDSIFAARVDEHTLHIVLGCGWKGVAGVVTELSFLDAEQGNAAIEVHVQIAGRLERKKVKKNWRVRLCWY